MVLTITLAWRHLYFPSLVSCNKNILCASRGIRFLALNTYTSFLRLTFYVAKLDWFVGAALLDSISRWDTPIAVRWSSSSISRGLTTECPNTPLLSSNFSGGYQPSTLRTQVPSSPTAVLASEGQEPLLSSTQCWRGSNMRRLWIFMAMSLAFGHSATTWFRYEKNPNFSSIS